MRFIEYIRLSEEYVDTYNYVGAEYAGSKFLKGPSEIFVNPTMKEIKSAAEQPGIPGFIRFIADYEYKNLYVFKAGVFHENVHSFLQSRDGTKISNIRKVGETSVWAVARFYKGKLTYDSSDSCRGKIPILLNKKIKDDWTAKWFGEPLLTTLKRDAGIISEEYVGSVIGNRGFMFKGGQTEVFMNPTLKEMKDASKASKGIPDHVRFIADFKNKNLFVFKADTFHVDVDSFLREKGIELGGHRTDTVWCVGNITKGKLDYVSTDNTYENASVMKMDDTWTSKWFNTPLLQSIRKEEGW